MPGPEAFRRPGPRLFGLPPGADFGPAVVVGLEEWLGDAPPEAWGRATILVPTARMGRRLRDAFDAGPPRLVPRLRLIGDLGLDIAGGGLPPPVPPLRRRLELMRLVAALLAREPDLAPRARAFDLAGSLADLLEEMGGEGVAPTALAGLDVADLSGHWTRALMFLRLLGPWFEEDGAAGGEARLRHVAERLARSWLTNPPADPVIVAGATASGGASTLLMEAVARLPAGAVILPGFDWDLPQAVWDRLDDVLTAEDHPQFRFARLLVRLGLARDDVRPWTAAPAGAAPDLARARLVSLSLRPPPVTDQWLTEGPALGPLGPATAGLTLLEAPSPRAEAEAIALRMRHAVEAGVTAALVSADRTLTRQVAAALDRWGIVPDDSAGEPLGLSPPGRLLRQVADLRGTRVAAGGLLALLKHPLCHAGADRGAHLRRVHAFELSLRRRGPAFPDARAVRAFVHRPDNRPNAPPDPGAAAWGEWLAGLLDGLAQAEAPGGQPLAQHLADHLRLAERAAAGSDPAGPARNPLWEEAAGRAAQAACEQLRRHAEAGGALSARDYAALVAGLLAEGEVRRPDRGHPRALIWGPIEARVQGADLVILGGLNEGTWPATPPADPWLNRRLRAAAGLLLPERRIGLAALDYMLAMGAPEVWMTRAVRDAEAPTTPSRWLGRLVNLLDGLPGQGGPAALGAMRARGVAWLARAEALSRPSARVEAAPRPSPRPPVAARPRRLSVTAIERLVRDPYAVYAEEVLRLAAIEPLSPEPDAADRGTILHRVFESWVREGHDPAAPDARDALLAVAARVLAEDCAWPVMARLWLAQVARIAEWFLRTEAERRRTAQPRHQELKGEVVLRGLGPGGALDVTLVARADRIDLTPDGHAVILDYKSGDVPTGPEQKAFAKQLLVTAAMAERGAFGALGAVTVERAGFVGLGGRGKLVAAPLDETPPAQVWVELQALLDAWADPGRGYSARMALKMEAREGRYDHLARFGEWDHTTPVTPEDLP